MGDQQLHDCRRIEVETAAADHAPAENEQRVMQAADKPVQFGEIGGDGLESCLVAAAEGEAADHSGPGGAQASEQGQQVEQVPDADRAAGGLPGEGLWQGRAGRGADDGGVLVP